MVAEGSNFEGIAQLKSEGDGFLMNKQMEPKLTIVLNILSRPNMKFYLLRIPKLIANINLI